MAPKEESLVQPELHCLKVVARVAVDHEVAVPESQVRNPA